MLPSPKVVGYELQTKKRATYEESTMEIRHDRIFSWLEFLWDKNEA